MKLTKKIIDAAQYDGSGYKGNAKGRYVLWDDKLTGFGLRINPAGKKSFVLSYRVHGRKRLITLGNYGVLTLDQARDIAKKYLVLANEGRDPLEERQKAARGEAFKELCTQYLERYAKPQKRSWKDDERRINKRLLPQWANWKIVNIRHADVATLHSKIGVDHPYEANRVVELISKMFQLAKKWGFVPDNFNNPAIGIDHFKEKKRDRWVTPEELPRLTQAINAESNLYAKQALWLYLLTGARKSEILKAKWEHLDWNRKELKLPETKADRIHYIPLSASALEVLRNTPKLEANPYIIPGLKPGAHLVNIDKPWQRVRKAAGVNDVRLHDLRRTVGSWLAQAGNSLHLIGRVLNHSSQSTTAIYARFGEDHVRKALEDHGNKLFGIAGEKPSADVVTIGESKKRVRNG